jgi:hypothetical protein
VAWVRMRLLCGTSGAWEPRATGVGWSPAAGSGRRPLRKEWMPQKQWPQPGAETKLLPRDRVKAARSRKDLRHRCHMSAGAAGLLLRLVAGARSVTNERPELSCPLVIDYATLRAKRAG